MATDVLSFDEFESSQQIAAHQSGLIRVILEGQTDVELFRRYWFVPFLEAFDFKEADHIVNKAGCTGVAAAVRYSIDHDGVPAIGIVDRDTLFRQRRWDVLYETDEQAFQVATRDNDVFVASRWEVEAYMLDPDLLARWVGANHKKPPASQNDRDMALSRALLECDFLIEISPFLAEAHTAGRSVSDHQFVGESKEKAIAECEAAIAASTADGQTAAAQVKARLGALKAVMPADDADRFRFALQYVDTKRLLVRLVSALQLTPKTHFNLMELQLAMARRPAELEGFLRDAKGRYHPGEPLH
ncbi:MAG: hypothetical protein ACTHNM_16150 [Dyella sp.]|uniref:hypothetical protein n=1 Tax=Dyella sp. TaxID=1869338 RepID=UPI003F7D8AED